jgi:hypothetical protein
MLSKSGARWRWRVGRVRTSAQLSIALAALEAALRRDDHAVAVSRLRRGNQPRQPAQAANLKLLDRRVGEGGYFEFKVQLATLVVPSGCSPGQVVHATVLHGTFAVEIPLGTVPGQQLRFRVHESAATVPPDGASASGAYWACLTQLKPSAGSAQLMFEVLEFQQELDMKARREATYQQEARPATSLEPLRYVRRCRAHRVGIEPTGSARLAGAEQAGRAHRASRARRGEG